MVDFEDDPNPNACILRRGVNKTLCPNEPSLYPFDRRLSIMPLKPGNEPSIDDYLHVRVFMLFHLPLNHLWNARNVCSSYWRLYVNNRSGASVELHPGTYDITPDKLHLIPAGVRFSCHNTQQLNHFYIHFDVLGLPPPLLQAVFDKPVGLAFEPATRTLVDSLLSDVKLTPDTTPKLYPIVLCRGKALVYTALAQALAQLPQPYADLARRLAIPAGQVAAAIQHIELNLETPLANDLLASLCHLSTDQFIRRFKEAVGMTPAQYILQRRVTTAAQQLLFTRDSIEKIAEDCGFANRFYFSRVFTRRMGGSPAAYRNAQRV